MAFAAMSCDAVRLLKALATDLTGEAQCSHRLCVLAPVPVQGGLLAAGEPADLASEPGTAGQEGASTAAQVSCRTPDPPHALRTLTAEASLQCGCAGG